MRRGILFGLVVLFIVMGKLVFSQSLFLNEIMSSNSNTISDSDGDYSDWIEIYNYGNEPVNLESYGLSDDADEPFKWVFPAMQLQAGNYLIVWASGKNRMPASSNVTNPDIHTNFSLSKDGEFLCLTHPNGNIVDKIEPVRLKTDISYGRSFSNTEKFSFFESPTPGKPNTGKEFMGILSPPVFTSEGGYYNIDFELELIHPDPDVEIIYTLDGSVPLANNISGSTYSYKVKYRKIQNQSSGPLINREYATHSLQGVIPIKDNTGIKISQTAINTRWEQTPVVPLKTPLAGVVVRAVALKDGYLPSEIITQTYIVKQQPYPVPIVSIVVPEKDFFDYNEGIYVPGSTFDNWRSDNWNADVRGNSPANFWMSGDDWEKNCNFELISNKGNVEINQEAGVSIHGGFSRSFQQKSLRFYARGGYGNDYFNYKFFNTKQTSSFKRILLRAAGNDCGGSFFRDAFIHSLVMGRKIDIQHSQPVVSFLNGEYWGIINIRDRNDKYYLQSLHGVDPLKLDILERNAVVKQGSNAHYLQMMEFVRKNDLSINANYLHLNTLVDVSNFAEYFAIQIYVNNQDWPHNNIDYWRLGTDSYQENAPYGHDGRWRWLLFDTDFGFWSSNRNPSQNTLIHATLAEGTRAWSTELFRTLLQNQQFKFMFINRLADLMNTSFYPDSVNAKYNEMKAVYDPIIDDQIDRWRRIANKGAWENSCKLINDFGQQRPAHVKQHLHDFFKLSGNYNLTTLVASGKGKIRINTIELDNPKNRKVTYFNNVPIELEAIPDDNYVFSHWSGINTSTNNNVVLNLKSNANIVAHFVRSSSPELIYFWAFDASMPNNTPLEYINATYHSIAPATIVFSSAISGYPFYSGHSNWRKASMERRNMPTDINYSMKGNNTIEYPNADIKGLQIKQPFKVNQNENMLVFNMSTANYEKLMFEFAAINEGAADKIIIDYSVSDNTASWTSQGLSRANFDLLPEYGLYRVDFGGVELANNNPNFKVRIRFDGSDMLADNGNRVTFNNISLMGEALGDVNLPPLVVADIELIETVEQAQATQVDLNKIFSAADINTLTYNAESSQNNIAEVSIAGAYLNIKPLRQGHSIVTLRASNGSNASSTYSFRVLVYPKAFPLANENFEFNYWSEKNPENTFPENMIFVQSEVDDPKLRTPLLYSYIIDHSKYHPDDFTTIGFPYNNLRRTRINGLGHDGISFINTGSGNDVGGAIVAINTTGMNNVWLNWTNETLLENERLYAQRLQYRVGVNGPFNDLVYNGQIQQYVSSVSGDVKQYRNVKLPNDALGQKYVQLLWRYYHLAGDEGSRAMLRLDDISIGSLKTQNSELASSQNVTIYPVPANDFINIETDNIISKLTILSVSGRIIYASHPNQSTTSIQTSAFMPGVYFLIMLTEKGIITEKIVKI